MSRFAYPRPPLNGTTRHQSERSSGTLACVIAEGWPWGQAWGPWGVFSQAKADFWYKGVSGDLVEAIETLHLDDDDRMKALQAKYNEWARRVLNTESFSDFLCEHLIMKGAYMLFNIVDGQAVDVQDQVQRLSLQWRTFVRMMTEGAGLRWFSQLLRDRALSSWVVLRCTLEVDEQPRQPSGNHNICGGSVIFGRQGEPMCNVGPGAETSGMGLA